MNPIKLWFELANGYLWIVLSIAAVFGAIGAMLHPPTKPLKPPEAADESPHQGVAKTRADDESLPSSTEPRRSRWWEMLSGAVAAVALLYVSKPESGVALVSGSLIAGFSATAVLAGLQARVLAALATQAADDSAKVAREARRQAAVSARLADDRAREMTLARQDLEHLARAAEAGADIKPLARDLRIRRGFAADAA